MLQIRRLLVAPLIITSLGVLAGHPLLDYYHGKIDLPEEAIVRLIDFTLKEKPSGHLMAYAYYLYAIRLSRSNQNFEAFEVYNEALKLLGKSDTIDNYLEFSVLRNQGVILKQHWLISEAIKKYEEALPYAYKFNITNGLSVKYNLGRALAYQNPEKALRVFVEIIDESEDEKLWDRKAKPRMKLD